MIPSDPSPSEAQPQLSAAEGELLGSVGRFDLLLELASGGMAMVYLGCAQERGAGPLVAIKRPHRHLATDKNFLTMLLDEARLASAIDHPNVVKVRELGFHVGEPFIVMDYVEGASVAELKSELSTRDRAIGVPVALRIVLDALAGLHAAHELADDGGKPLGIVHRDISPHNVLVSSDGRSRVTDFGIAHATDRLQVTKTHEVKGKLAYLAPERVDQRRICTRQSDVFSMAIVLWESVVGRRLFGGDQAVDTLQEVLHARIPRLSEVGVKVSRKLEAVVARALSRDLGERYATAKDFALALEGAAGPSLIASEERVAQLVNVLYADRLAARDQRVRAALQDDAVADRLVGAASLARLRKQPPLTGSASLAVLDAVAPLAPSAQYAFGAAGLLAPPPSRRRRVVAGGVSALAAVAIAIVLASAHDRHVGAVTPQATPLQAGRSAAAAPEISVQSPVQALAVPLPFIATQLTFDGVLIPLAPASDLAHVSLALDAGSTHTVVATALDGTVAEAEVEAVGGFARPVGAGFSLLTRTAGVNVPVSSPQAPAARRGAGTVKNGFTKLK